MATAVGMRFAEKVVVQPESGHAACRFINNPIPERWNMQKERPRESNLVTGREDLNDLSVTGKPGVCVNSLTYPEHCWIFFYIFYHSKMPFFFFLIEVLTRGNNGIISQACFLLLQKG